jgi:hypothetical protein
VDASAGAAGLDVCWPFRGKLTKDGYGRVNSGGRTLLAHRVVLEAKLGRRLAVDEVTRHGRTCTTRACCNPDHLSPGTSQDNADDMVADGRSLRGERSATAKLTAAQACEIVRLASTMGRGKYEALGRQFGISGKQVANICKGRRWPHLTDEHHARLHSLAAEVVAGRISLADAERLAVRR